MGRVQVINEAEDVRVVVPLRISYRSREGLRLLAEAAGQSVNQYLIEALLRGGVDVT
jgi:predicted HicB family RNase H-like nuclease